jgi:cell division transport system permease protein
LVLTVTFFIATSFSFITVGIYQGLKYFESRPQVLIFFKNDATETDTTTLRDAFTNHPKVSQVVYVPQEEALNIYRQLNQNDPLLLELVTADILPASLEISTTDLDSLKQIAAEAKEAPGVEEVVLRTDVVDLLNKWLNGIKLAGTTFITVMTLTSLIIIVIVVGMKIAGKNYEIKVLRLIGASSWYIQGPFLVEGALYGLVSAVLAFMLSFIILLYSTPFILNFAGEVPLLPQDPLIYLLILSSSILLGTFIGTIGSWIAVKRFLD